MDRYGLALDTVDLNDICRDIQENKGEFIEQNPDGNTLWWLDVKGVRCRLVISADFYDVVTFLPPFEKSAKHKLRKFRKVMKKRARMRRVVYKHGTEYYEPTDGVEL